MKTFPVVYAVSLKDKNNKDSGLAYATAELQRDCFDKPQLKLVSRSGTEFFVDADALDNFFAAMAVLKADVARVK